MRRFNTIAGLDREAWNQCFPDALETYDYFCAIERSHIPGFTHGYYAVIEDGALLAAVPAFFTNYDLATTADGWVKKTLLGMKRIAPSLMTPKLACLGSAETESCPVAMHPFCHEGQKRDLFAQLLRCFDTDAKAQQTHLMAVKDLAAYDQKLYDETLVAQGFHGVSGMPSAVLPINFSSIDDYLSRLSKDTRKDMRRKLRLQSEVRIEYRRNIDDLIEPIYAMYLDTKSRSDLQFEELTRDYFLQTLACMGERSVCAVYFLGQEPIGANLMLINEERLLDKFFCMKSDIGREYNLYFLSWFANVQLCLDRGLKYYQSGQAGYDTKLRLGSELLSNRMYFRHRNPIADALLKLASPLLAFDVPDLS